MTNEWSSPHWHILHGAAKFASLLVMVRTSVINKDNISVAHHVPGRLMQVRLHLSRPHDILAIYQQAWNPTGGVSALLTKCQYVWKQLRDCLAHIPQAHTLLLSGDFNTPLDYSVGHVFSHDPKYQRAAQTDRALLQDLVRDYDLLAVHTQNKYVPTFIHGDHRSRTNFALMRRAQIKWHQIQAHHLPDFDFLFAYQGPRHIPLSLTIPKWYPVPKPKSSQHIDRFRIRQAWQQNSSGRISSPRLVS